MNNKKYKFDLIVILGATATGKTNLAVKIADKYNGEIISADSRQIYKKLNIGTGKDYNEYIINDKKIHYHLIDIIEPNIDYSVFQFQNDFKTAYNKIKSKNKVPILCGGTGLYIESILLDYPLNNIGPNYKLREKLESKSINSLLKLAGEKFIKNANESELNNKRRIIRYIERINQTQRKSKQVIKIDNPLIIGTNFDRSLIRKKIKKRLLKRLNEGLVEEVKNLLNNGISNDRLEKIGLEYKFVSQYLNNIYSKDEFILKLTTRIQQFAKRQLSWFRRMERRKLKINWVDNADFNTSCKIIEDKIF
ncbi:MAG: tRNA (adenosine(37)-N6)-dimethylallyltransferase MiaA [Candidatus Marinimicrobia bacterium]|nr:tRNA (adenosine(37)-N6)-dimethylallyltransferase MiaA [Candidatus Neomarinimicrobiota bacterium]|tara:strand:+ start:46 stop:966 length:921 start_codon:yes stop_codon:yes gene_type:complete